MGKTKSIAVLVINYNGKQHLGKFFDSLAECDERDELAVFLVDNDSSDGSADYAVKHYPGVKVLNTGSNLGFAGAYNYAHSELRRQGHDFEYYFIVNNDTILHTKGMFPSAISLFEHDESIGIVAPTIVNEEQVVQLAAGEFIFFTGTTLGKGSGSAFQPSGRKFLSKWASGCAFFIKSSLFEELRGFEDYFMYMEDVGLSWKVLNANKKIVTDGGVSVIHIGGGTEKPSAFEHYYAERNRVLMYWQNLSSPVFLVMLPLFLLLRMVLLFKQGSLRIAAVKARAIVSGLLLVPRYPKRNRSIRRDVETIKIFISPITEYENPLSNS